MHGHGQTQLAIELSTAPARDYAYAQDMHMAHKHAFAIPQYPWARFAFRGARMARRALGCTGLGFWDPQRAEAPHPVARARLRIGGVTEGAAL